MTQPQEQSLVDTGNPLLDRAPVQIDVGDLGIPGGQRLAVLTFRSPSATFTAFLGAEDVRRWATLLSDLAVKMEGGLVTAPAGALDELEKALRNGRK